MVMRRLLWCLAALLLLAAPAAAQNRGDGGFSPAVALSPPEGGLSLSTGIPGCPISSQPANLLTSPNDFVSGWSDSGGGTVTVNAGAANDPCSGAADASQLLDTTSTGGHYWYNPGSGVSVTSGATVTDAIFVKQSTGRYTIAGFANGGASEAVYIVIDTQTWAVQSGTSGGGSYSSSSCSPDGDGWYYCKVTGALPGASSYFAAFSLSNSSSPGSIFPSYTGTGVGVFAYQGRLSLGTQ